MNWRETQAAFAAALRDPAAAVPDAVGPRGAGAPKSRFNVYRNNSAVSLMEAVGDSFPVVRELVGEDFFTAMARAFVGDHMPRSPVLVHYGGEFAAFIDDFGQTESVPFLADVARVEWAWVEAYHAADRAAVNAEALQAIAPEALDQARLALHPSLRLLRSEWPAISIWSAHQLDDPSAREAALGAITPAAEHGLLLRPEFEVDVHVVQPAVWQLLAAFCDGATLGAAAESLAGDDIAHFGGMLGFIFSTGAVVAVLEE